MIEVADSGLGLIYLGEPYLNIARCRRPREVTYPMYVCVCHAVTEGDVRDKWAAGATSPKAVRAACGMRPGCGACVRRIRSLLDDCAAERAAERAERLDAGAAEHAPAA